MQKSYRFLMSALLLGALLLSACGGSLPGQDNDRGAAGVNSNDIADDDANFNINSNADMDDDREIFGVVEALTDTTITINGVTYSLAGFTGFRDAVGDQVKIHVIVNADGTFTIREIELSSDDDDDNGNDNDNGNSNDDASNSNSNGNSNGNSNDNDNGNSNTNSNDNGDDDDNDNDD